MRSVLLGCILAAAFWFVLFSPWTFEKINFWGVMVAASGTLAIYGIASNKPNLRLLYTFHPKWILVGIVSAAILYILFFAGDKISAALFGFAPPQVAAIYGTKIQASPTLIGALLFFWIGPCEEIFWRGFAQPRFAQRFGVRKGYIITSMIYAGIHVWAFNFMLFMAAIVCALFWGWMFLKYNSVWPGLISHAVWDLSIFVLLPIR